MEQSNIDKTLWRPTNPHDRFCRRTIFHPLYAPDFLKSYGDSVLKDCVDLDHLQEAPTTHLSDELKELIMDASLTTRLLNTKSLAEVLMHLEHIPKPVEKSATMHCGSPLCRRLQVILHLRVNGRAFGKFQLAIV